MDSVGCEVGRRKVEMEQTTFTVSLEAVSESSTDVAEEGKKKRRQFSNIDTMEEMFGNHYKLRSKA